MGGSNLGGQNAGGASVGGQNAGGASVGGQGVGGTAGMPSTESGPDSGTFAQGVELLGVEVNQGAAFAIAADGETLPVVERRVQVIPAREALVRAIYSVSGSPGMVEGRLTLYREDGSEEILTSTRDASNPSDLTRLGGTFEWRLNKEQVAPGVQYSVGLFVPGAPDAPAPSDVPRIPDTGSADFGVSEEPMRLEIVLVDAGKAIDPGGLEIIRDVLYQVNPVS
jgi:hypothetical protein